MGAFGVGFLPRSRLPHLLGGLLLAFGIALAATRPGDGFASVAMSTMLFAGVVVLSSIASFRVSPWRPAVAGELSVADWLSFEGRPLVRRTRITGAMVLRRKDGAPVLRLARAWPHTPIDFVVGQEPVIAGILEALALDPSSSTTRIVFGSRVRLGRWEAVTKVGLWTLAVCTPVLIGLAAEHVPGAMEVAALALLAAAAWCLLASVPTCATFGLDGVLVTWLGFRRFVAYSSLAHASRFRRGTGVGVALRTRRGYSFDLLFPLHLTRRGLEPDLRFEMRRIAASIALQPSSLPDPPDLLCARGARSHTDWVRELRRLVTRPEADHRTNVRSVDELASLVDDARAPPVVRCAAAVALGASAAATDHERLRRAARTTALPEASRVFDLARGGDERACARALERVEAAMRASC